MTLILTNKLLIALSYPSANSVVSVLIALLFLHFLLSQAVDLLMLYSILLLLFLVDYCSPNPCKNNGVCVVEEGKGYSCVCKPGFTGFHCQGKEH